MRRIKVLIWSPMGSGPFYNGPGQTAFRMFSCADKAKWSFDLVHFNKAHPPVALFDNIYFLEKSRFPFFNYLPTSLNPSIQWLKENAHRYDIIYGLSGMMPVSVPLSYASKYLAKKTVIKLVTHNSDLVVKSMTKKLLGLDKIKRHFLRDVTQLIAISTDIYRECLSYGFDEHKLSKIPNAVNTLKFAPLNELQRVETRARLKIENNSKVVLFVGALYERKNPKLLLDAVKKVRHIVQQVEVIFVGPSKDTVYSKEFLAEIDKCEFARHVEFSDSIEEYYACCDVFCLPSVREGFANSVLESMSSSTATLSKKISGAADVIVDGVNGLFVDEQSDLEEKLSKCLVDDSFRHEIAVKARETILSQYSVEVILNNYHRLFSELLNE